MSGSQPETPALRVALTPEERELYSRLFKSLDPEGSGIVTGDKARATFEKSGLPANVLGEIWQMADSANLGFLTQLGFCVAMRLIGYTQAGHFPTAQLAQAPGPVPRFADMPRPAAPARTPSAGSLLLQAQPSAFVPQNTATQHAQPQAPVAPVAAADVARFAAVYVRTTGSAAARLDGAAAKRILTKAKLPTATLGQIWSLVDVHNRGSLDVAAFVVAMHLVQGLLGGSLTQLPPFLPEYVWRSVDAAKPAPAAPLARDEWHASAQQAQQFDAIFRGLDALRSGALPADQVASFLMASRLDQQDLAAIWDLADIQNTGVFGPLELGIALFLIDRRRAGLALPDVVPQELISSLQQAGPPAPPPHSQAAPASPVLARSSMDELADIFGAPAPAAAAPSAPRASSPQPAGLQRRASSSDLSQAHEPPQARLPLPAAFKPSSSFGQSLVSGHRAQPTAAPADLIGDDASASPAAHPRGNGRGPGSPAPQAPPANPQAGPDAATAAASAPAPGFNQQRTVDYEALRSVPAPPQSRLASSRVDPPVPEYSQPQRVASPARNVANDDLLADSEVSGKLSEATSDIANFSNQIKSLSTQTSNLHDKKTRAEKELARILAVKEEINGKLKLLRTSYASEVKQVEQVEMTLNNAKEELEALRSEASIAEARFNSIATDRHEKQLAVEENQKLNSSLREKLGNLNAEIAALESEHQRKAAENTTLSNEANVRKSQVQVALVKVDELKRKILEAEASYEAFTTQITDLEQQRLAAELQTSELANEHEGLSRSLSEVQLKHLLLAGSVGTAAGLAVGAGAHLLSSKGDLDGRADKLVQDDEKNAALLETSQHQASSKGDAAPPTHQKSDETESSAPESEDLQNATAAVSVAAIVDEVKQQPAPDLTGVDDMEVAEHKDTLFEETDYVTPKNDSIQSNPTFFSVAGIVDEIKEHSAKDLTGLDDASETERKDTLFNEQESNSLKQNFPPVPIGYENPGHLSTEYNSANLQDIISKKVLNSSAATDFQRQTEGADTGETPVTTPSNSEYRFQQSNAGVVGGMVGMPGVLVGVQRTDSLTSSVQNNPSMSVRDDNIDEISDRDTLEDNAGFSEIPSREHKQSDGHVDEFSEGERLSSGVELFELVNADEAKGSEGVKNSPKTLDTPTHPLAQSYRASELSSGSGSQQVEEFPSPKELDYDESSSDESESNIAVNDQFDDANENFAKQSQSPPEYDSESDFNDLEPATNETGDENVQDEFFDEDFDNLKLADDDNQEEIDVHDVSFDDHFTGADNFGGFSQQSAASTAPDFSSAVNGSHADNDEWEQLFAGFGNATPVAQLQNFGATAGPSTHESAVQELVGMGFQKETVVEALEKENYDVEAATNYLLDHA
ncbi:hypothetical protein METBIDRAFT_13159 [Metschnikowia bicuspidata var. bicuspidata NRRL YB-4993]|uniref:UBA domain-containing protein n=1 Tax=Metschnikowia bicuspidata var. bicuspidata NRRL YB-4993 TaxID=869754 RepID=A0A1A0H801_9ASCO|nr:hypothetical protein METBIDRAFT_13159 [Metschnikowia bicuspidata var. bicuspidata NRRL YB-4993]OBA20151.1 hypothetical protein METBIDRAFT_13159 [Metschnikowia bicuspidata var. bicuspidata NRRL YB-4993]